MPWVVHNGHLAHIEDRLVFGCVDDAISHIMHTHLSPCAYAVLMTAPPTFRNGGTVSLAVLADFARQHITQVHAAVNELAQYGFVRKTPYGKSGRLHRYSGVPTMMWSSPVTARIAVLHRAV